jgi:hypothetical protein
VAAWQEGMALNMSLLCLPSFDEHCDQCLLDTCTENYVLFKVVIGKVDGSGL